jgi:hypothetical protein
MEDNDEKTAAAGADSPGDANSEPDPEEARDAASATDQAMPDDVADAMHGRG